MSDDQYVRDYPVTVDNAEEWCRAMEEIILDEIFGEGYSGQHRSNES